MKYCSQCGKEVRSAIPAGDNRSRHICDHCPQIHYSNPNMVVGCLPVWKSKQILLCRRSIEPRSGYWTVPSGFMENGETLEEGALRETREEACASVEIEGLFSAFSLPRVNQVYMLFLSRLLDLDFAAGEESAEVRLFDFDEIPWSAIAFRAVEFALQRYVEDGADSGVHLGQYVRKPGDRWTLLGD